MLLKRILLPLFAAVAVVVFGCIYYTSTADSSTIARTSLTRTVRLLELHRQEGELMPGTDLKDFDTRLKRIRLYWHAARAGEPFGKAAKACFVSFMLFIGLSGLFYLGSAYSAWRIPGWYNQFMHSSFVSAALACVMLFFTARTQLAFTVTLYYDIQSAATMITGIIPLLGVDDMLNSERSINLVALIMGLQMAFFILFLPAAVYVFLKLGKDSKPHV